MKQKKECANQECKKQFTPKRPHQKYHTAKCRWDEWNRTHPRLTNNQDVQA